MKLIPVPSIADQGIMSLASISGKYEYAYPKNSEGTELDLRPSSELCKKIIREVAVRAQSANSEIQRRSDIWTELERCLRVYIPADAEERKTKREDPRRPVSVVVPMSIALRDTLLTYIMSVLGADPIYRYTGVGPEDMVGAVKLERIVNLQATHAKHLLAHRVQWCDALTYGFGVLAPIWEPKRGRVHRMMPQTSYDAQGIPVITGSRREAVTGITWEGHYLQSIHPRNCLFDPNVCEYELQRAEFAGYLVRDNYVGVLGWEQRSEGRVFNAKYLRHMHGKSCLMGAAKDLLEPFESSGGGQWNTYPSDDQTRPIDLCHMYVNLIPREWELGTSEYPEKWYFCIAGDSLVIVAEPLGRQHDMFPLTVCAPDYDGHIPLSISRMEVTYPMQSVLNFLINQHILEQRKSVGGTTIIDQSILNLTDLEQPGPRRIVRLRRPIWGHGKLSDAIYTVPDTNVTSANISDSLYMMNVMERVSGASSTMQGIVRQGGSERLTATEARGAQTGAMGRAQALARIIGMQAIQDCAYLLGAQTQQFMTEDAQIRILGRQSEILAQEYGNAAYATVRPDEIDIDYDVIASDGVSQAVDDLAPLSEFVKTLIATPQGQQVVATAFDTKRVLLHFLRLAGLRDIDEFQAPAVPAQMQVMPDEQAMQQAQAGNLIPVGGGPFGG